MPPPCPNLHRRENREYPLFIRFQRNIISKYQIFLTVFCSLQKYSPRTAFNSESCNNVKNYNETFESWSPIS